MKITRDKRTSEIQAEFSSEFPYLKIVFYKHAHENFQGSEKKDELTEDVILSVLNPKITEGEMKITKDLSVENLESIFESDFGLHIQVFRKSGDQWLQTSVTDHWSLEKHSQSAMEYEKFVTK